MNKMLSVFILTLSSLLLVNCGDNKSVHKRPGRGTACKDFKTVNVPLENTKATKKLSLKTIVDPAELKALNGKYQYQSSALEFRSDLPLIFYRSHNVVFGQTQKAKDTQLEKLLDQNNKNPLFLSVGCSKGFKANSTLFSDFDVRFSGDLELNLDDPQNPTKLSIVYKHVYKYFFDANLNTLKKQGVYFDRDNSETNTADSFQELAKAVEPSHKILDTVNFYEISPGVYQLNYKVQIDNTSTATININYKKIQ